MDLLQEIDELLAMLEDTAHGYEGRAITEMRGKIQFKLTGYCKQCLGSGRVVDDEFTGETIPCETCGGEVKTSTLKQNHQ